MVPESSSDSPPKNGEQDEMVLAGYRECATEAMKWLSNLGYRPGHPLMRSLAAHLTKKQAYLEKVDLECFLVEQSMRKEEDDEDGSDDETTFLERLKEVRNDPEIQRALVEAAFRGCDLRYQ
ncbi:UNVERIFIED_CONTAM: hypothetical protein PYX00_002716 [Menopon gallinae]|uniref:Timeless n=1 Tax=Menopon gallinae TaxID=328185 RepID=A0AAW2HYK2_9NEOP